MIAYNPQLSHLYLPGAESATLAIASVSEKGKLSLLATAQTALGAHCAAADDRGNVWICDPEYGRLLLFKEAHWLP